MPVRLLCAAWYAIASLHAAVAVNVLCDWSAWWQGRRPGGGASTTGGAGLTVAAKCVCGV